MLTVACIFGGQKLMHLFSTPTPDMNEWMNFLKKVKCPSKDPRAPRKVSRYMCFVFIF